MRIRNNQAGIAIGPILFIVALLGLLAAAIAAGGSSFSGGTATESARAGAAAIMAYGDQVKIAVDRMRFSQDISDTQLSFVYNMPRSNGTSQTGAYNNTSCSSDSCRLFSAGGITVKDFYQWANQTLWPGAQQRAGSLWFRVGQFENIGSSENELFFIVDGLSFAVGEEIARRLGIANSYSFSMGGSSWVDWAGAIDESWFTVASRVWTGAAVRGREVAVLCSVSWGYCAYMRVLIVR